MSQHQPSPVFINIGTLNFGAASADHSTLEPLTFTFATDDQATPLYQDLGNGEEITQKEALAELAKLGDGWRLETPQELFGLVDYDAKNQHGARTRDESLKAGWYWTSQETPWYRGGRVVVGFASGDVDYDDGYLRARARAVRVSGQ